MFHAELLIRSIFKIQSMLTTNTILSQKKYLNEMKMLSNDFFGTFKFSKLIVAKQP